VPVQPFDLNIQEFLESWTMRDAVREILANALDEALLSRSRTPETERVGPDTWEIRDWGRGLRPEHFAQAENEEKGDTQLPVIGRFGVGLKDALATLHRHGVKVEARSKHAAYSLVRHGKHGFDSLQTLHVAVDKSGAWDEPGTVFRLQGLPDAEMMAAKELFLQFSPQPVLAEGQYGDVLAHPGRGPAPIYVRGLRVAVEENFLFAYNITSLTKAMKVALNRERTNVGRTAYADRIKRMLLGTTEPEVADALAWDLEGIAAGTSRDEVKNWSDVAVHACKVLNQRGDALFVDAHQLSTEVSSIDLAKDEGLRVVTVPSSILAKLRGAFDYDGKPLKTLEVAAREWKESFKFEFVDESSFTSRELEVWSLRDRILDAVGGRPGVVREIRVSETMRPEIGNPREVVGLWDGGSGSIIVKRSQLAKPGKFAGTLTHELAHARSGRPDVDRDFEAELTRMLGTVIAVTLEQPSAAVNTVLPETPTHPPASSLDAVHSQGSDPWWVRFARRFSR